MACYHPIPARRADDGPWTLNPPLGSADSEVPCGKCIGCRSDKAYEWTIRATHEARLHAENRFLTLTYDDEHCPPELQPQDLQRFLKRLRRANDRNHPGIISTRSTTIRYLACGEYGTKKLRPHYHLCLFNCGFADERQYNQDLNTSETLSALWPFGFATVGPFTAGAAGYIAGYLVKTNQKTYADADGVALQPPFRRASCKPAIGKNWLDQHANDLQHGYVIHDGRKSPVPRYYQKKLIGHATWEDTKQKLRAYSNSREPARREAAEKIHEGNQKTKNRRLE